VHSSFSAPIEEVNVRGDEGEAKTIFKTLDAHNGGQVDALPLHRQLTMLGYSQDKVDEIMYIADRRCVGKISYMQYWNAILPHIFENRVRHRASTIHPIFRSDDGLPEIEPLTPPESPKFNVPAEAGFSRLPSSASIAEGFGRLPSAAASIASVVSKVSSHLLRSLQGAQQCAPPSDGDSTASNSSKLKASRVQPEEPDLENRSPEETNSGANEGPETAAVSPSRAMTSGLFGASKLSRFRGVTKLSVDEFGDLAEEVMARSLFFFALDKSIVRALLLHASHLTLQAGEYLLAEDEKISHISVVRSGTLKLYWPAEEEGTIGEAAIESLVEAGEPKRTEFAQVSTGDVIGEFQCLHKENCSVFIRAETKCRILQIPRPNIMQMLPRRCREYFDPPDAMESPLASPIRKMMGIRPRMGESPAAAAHEIEPADGTGPVAPQPPVGPAGSHVPHKGGGCMYEGSRCIAKNLPSLKSGDRVRLKVERGFGHMRVWINEHELGTTISGFQV